MYVAHEVAEHHQHFSFGSLFLNNQLGSRPDRVSYCTQGAAELHSMHDCRVWTGKLADIEPMNEAAEVPPPAAPPAIPPFPRPNWENLGSISQDADIPQVAGSTQPNIQRQSSQAAELVFGCKLCDSKMPTRYKAERHVWYATKEHGHETAAVVPLYASFPPLGLRLI
jgi:hypothetical protein